MKKLLLYTFFLLIILFSPEYFTQDLSEIKIGVVYSERTKSIIYPHDQKFYPIQDWELFFLSRKISYTVIKDEGLDDNDFEELDVLILPSVEILSKKASENLKEFLANGKGLFILGNFGTHDKEGEKNGGTTSTKLPAKYTVKSGDSLWKIAKAKYGTGEKWAAIASENKISNPDQIFAGSSITLPKAQDYKVKAGDTLWDIAEQFYGDGFQWTKIRDANPSKIGTLPNGNNLIMAGQTLVVP